MSQAALAEITYATQALAQKPTREVSPAGFRRFMIRVPEIRVLVKQGYTFYHKPANEVLRIWDYVWKNAEWYEVAHQALYFYQHRSLTRAEFNKIKTWVNRCDCWEHSDDLSKIYAQVVEDNPTWILPLYKNWNQARSPWQRRQSIVGLIEYAKKRQSVLPYQTLIDFVEPLLTDKDYYVQKGVGWTLREIYNIYPQSAAEFIETHLNTLTPNAYSAATEKLDQATKHRFNQLRKTLRQLDGNP